MNTSSPVVVVGLIAAGAGIAYLAYRDIKAAIVKKKIETATEDARKLATDVGRGFGDAIGDKVGGWFGR